MKFPLWSKEPCVPKQIGTQLSPKVFLIASTGRLIETPPNPPIHVPKALDVEFTTSSIRYPMRGLCQGGRRVGTGKATYQCRMCGARSLLASSSLAKLNSSRFQEDKTYTAIAVIHHLCHSRLPGSRIGNLHLQEAKWVQLGCGSAWPAVALAAEHALGDGDHEVGVLEGQTTGSDANAGAVVGDLSNAWCTWVADGGDSSTNEWSA